MTDIVERLREYNEPPFDYIAHEAAAEIEQLRGVLFGEETLEMLLAGKKSLFSCSEDPQFEDARSCFEAMVDAAFPKKEKE